MALTDYIGVFVSCPEDFHEILIAELADLGFESMLETDDGIEAYIDENEFNRQALEDMISRYIAQQLTYRVEKVATRNWNEEWEKNYDPIVVEEKCIVRATFHKPQPEFPYEIIINPRMSFGTGHHSTTYLMLQQQLQLDHRDKRVLDAGCGTAILAIMAEKLGASEVLAYDNNTWTIENLPENLILNNCTHIAIQEGTIESIEISGNFDIILANINRNVLMDELPMYASYLAPSGVLILSGFYQKDEAGLTSRAQECGLTRVNTLQRNDWSSLRFENK